MKHLIKVLLANLFCTVVLTNSFAWATPTQQIALQDASQRDQELDLQWWVEGLRGQTIKSVELLIDGHAIKSQKKLESARGQSVCYLLMVDTSGSMKKYFKNKSLKKLLKSLIEKKPDQHYLGFALFAKEWKEIQSPTKDKAVLLKKLVQVVPKGNRTELLRFAKEGVSTLNTCPKETYRKILVILSDGDAEDQADTVELAVQKARNSQISMYAFGFGDTGKLQYPRRLSEESGGWLAEPKDYINNRQGEAALALYADSNTGGELHAILPKDNVEKIAQLKLTLSNDKTLVKSISLKTKALPQLPVWKKKILDKLSLTEKQLDYVLWGLGLLLLGLLGWFLIRLLRSDSTTTDTPRNIEGYLIHQGQSYPVYSGITRLGSLPDNDIAIDTDTVSRAHATLHYQGEGDVVLTDLNSLNGSSVNGNRIERPTSIQDGDTVGLGNWEAIFQRIEK